MNYLIDKFNANDGTFEMLHTFTDVVNDLPVTFLAKWYISVILKKNCTEELLNEVIKRIKVSPTKQTRATIEDKDGIEYFIDVINDEVKLRNRKVKQALGITEP